MKKVAIATLILVVGLVGSLFVLDKPADKGLAMVKEKQGGTQFGAEIYLLAKRLEWEEKKNETLNSLVEWFVGSSLPAPESLSTIKYGKKDIKLGEWVFFNSDDGFYFSKTLDPNGFVYPHKERGLEKGIFIKSDEEIAWLYFPNVPRGSFLVVRPVVKLIPQQNVVLLNW